VKKTEKEGRGEGGGRGRERKRRARERVSERAREREKRRDRERERKRESERERVREREREKARVREREFGERMSVAVIERDFTRERNEENVCTIQQACESKRERQTWEKAGVRKSTAQRNMARERGEGKERTKRFWRRELKRM